MSRLVTSRMLIEPALPSNVVVITNKVRPISSYGQDTISIRLLRQRVDDIIQTSHTYNKQIFRP